MGEETKWLREVAAFVNPSDYVFCSCSTFCLVKHSLQLGLFSVFCTLAFVVERFFPRSDLGWSNVGGCHSAIRWKTSLARLVTHTGTDWSKWLREVAAFFIQSDNVLSTCYTFCRTSSEPYPMSRRLALSVEDFFSRNRFTVAWSSLLGCHSANLLKNILTQSSNSCRQRLVQMTKGSSSIIHSVWPYGLSEHSFELGLFSMLCTLAPSVEHKFS